MKYQIPLNFFFVMDGTEFNHPNQYEMMPCKNILVSAYGIINRGFGSLIKCRKNIDKIYVDSGGISAWKKRDIAWMKKETQELYVEKTRKLNPSAICHLDLPMEPKFLEMNRFSKDEALKQTLENAEAFLELNVGDAEKIFGLQGWRINDYVECISSFDELGVFSSEHIIGIGTTCMRRPPSLYQVYEKIIPIIRKINPKQRIHAFGIARPEWVYHLHNLGINSGDSATSVVISANREIALDKGRRVNIKVKPLPKDGARSLFLLNSWIWYMRLWNAFNKEVKQTSFTVYEQG